MEQFAVEARHLTKRFGGFTAVDEVSFGVRPGEIVGFLGLNGAGKTTTLRMVLGLLAPSSGEASVLGIESVRDRASLFQRVGYLPDAPTFYEYLRGREIL